MARKIYRNRKKCNFSTTFEQLYKRFRHSSRPEVTGCHKCASSKDFISDKGPCIACLKYKAYHWGVLKSGEVIFCCHEDKFDIEREFNDGHKILSEYKPTLEKIIKGK